MSNPDPHFPGRAPIDAYGNGGFRFAGLSHRGSLLLLPSGIYAWPVKVFEELVPTLFERVIAESDDIDFLLLGTGDAQRMPPESVRTAFEKADVGLEFMDTGAACRTYNVLLAEERAVAAALVAVE
jgi:uncharacterized protein